MRCDVRCTCGCSIEAHYPEEEGLEIKCPCGKDLVIHWEENPLSWMKKNIIGSKIKI